jgi:DNA-directed RNA polymerase subunit RPC12/RpoP
MSGRDSWSSWTSADVRWDVGSQTLFEPAGGHEVFVTTPWKIERVWTRRTFAFNYCPFCGSKVKDSWNYCPYCGRRLVEERELAKNLNIYEDTENLYKEEEGE